MRCATPEEIKDKLKRFPADKLSVENDKARPDIQDLWHRFGLSLSRLQPCETIQEGWRCTPTDQQQQQQQRRLACEATTGATKPLEKGISKAVSVLVWKIDGRWREEGGMAPEGEQNKPRGGCWILWLPPNWSSNRLMLMSTPYGAFIYI